MVFQYRSGDRPTNRQLLVGRGCVWGVYWFAMPAGGIQSAEPGVQVNSPLATASVRLLIEQIDQLVGDQQFDEALHVLAKLFDESAGQMVEYGPPQKAATQVVERLIPVRHWIHERLGQLLREHATARKLYHDANDESAAAIFNDIVSSNDMRAAEDFSARYWATQSGTAAHLLLADLSLERGWSMAAKQFLQFALREGSPWQVSLQAIQELGHLDGPQGNVDRIDRPVSNVGEVQASPSENIKATQSKAPVDSVVPLQATASEMFSWPIVWQKLDESRRKPLVKHWLATLVGRRSADRSQARFEEDLVVCLVRLVQAAALEPSVPEFEATTQWASTVAELLLESSAEELRQNIQQARQWFDARSAGQDGRFSVKSFAGGQDRQQQFSGSIEVNAWPTWRQRVDRITANLDRNVAGKPRVAENELGALPYFPVVHQGKVYVNHMRSIFAFDLKTGKNWPSAVPALALYDTGVNAEAFVPLGYPMVGVPRGTLTIADEFLFARMGPPVTAWANREANAETGSFGYIVGLDLRRQGRMLPGFPLYLNGSEFTFCEPEGCPIVLGENLLVAVVQRDNVGLRRFVAAFDRVSGQLRWRSRTLGVGAIEGSQQANLISHQLLSAVGGRVYYNTNLGTVACLDAASGNVLWMVRYRRQSLNDQFPGSSHRFRYRDLTPCLISGNLVYCAPQDCPEVFALDAATGNLVWSTSAGATADVVHLLGVSESSLIVSGDRILWIDRITGRLQARFPAMTTSGTLNSLPSPRGIGRGLIADNLVYWPTARELFVFPAIVGQTGWQLDAPPIHKRMRLDVRDVEGGNLVVADGVFLIASPSRLNAFAQPPSKPVSIQIRATP